MKHIKTLLTGLFALLMLPFLIACGGGTSSTVAQSGAQTGTLSLSLKDAPIDLQAVYVTIKEVQVHMGDNEVEDANESNNVAGDQNSSDNNAWKVVVAPNKTYNLLALQDGVTAFLGEENLTVGHYTQMRLILGTEAEANATNILGNPHDYANYVVVNNQEEELVVPSGFQTGIKLIKGFDIYTDQNTSLMIDFDANKSVHLNGNGYTMKPTITITEE